MISRDQLAFAARYADAQCGELTLPGWCEHHGVALDDVAWLSEQRAWRNVLAMRGKPGRAAIARIARGDHVRVEMSRQEEALVPFIVGAWIDGFATGLTVQQKNES